MPRVIHFEIHAEDPQRAADFYTQLLGWEITPWAGMDYWMIKTGEPDAPGIDGGLLRRQGTIDGTAVIAYVCTVDVADLDATLEKALALGGQLALPKMPIPGVGWLAYAKDTEGNIFGMMQNDPGAK
ncbi:MAG: VOC family protein [Blastocatellia bacterium]|nr:VOC family protein [Blastocatellia bacterium]